MGREIRCANSQGNSLFLGKAKSGGGAFASAIQVRSAFQSHWRNSDMKILIPGNMGYVGPSVLQRLRQSYPRATLIALDKGYFAQCLTNAAILTKCVVHIQYFADVRNHQPELFQRVDAIVRLAA